MKNVLLTFSVLVILILSGCGETNSNSVVKSNISFYKDPKTSCQYIIYAGGTGVSMIERNDNSGKQICEKEIKQ